ncbi:hypothetical protein GCM10025866_00590 [Naasia aerilata]|uniref:DegT/DnrJ/EryC1/StrS aminotransferase family protein n=1 Tax=Naasia aerilata TaxID=1162966 RepID=A0ABN6XH83_9MICO|nr:DegT/DnrJ/EryC1/StrS family aminotransferase [Naasia aerilata]BDZ44150.1 hypothetical protein GCM10025866_00590 [Naasia aerilata]
MFSFHGTKFVNAFEGGALVTDDDDLAERARLIRNFGFSGYDKVVSVGTNAKLPEVSAAMGLTSIESMDQFIEVNRRNHEAYRAGLDGVPGITLLGDLPDSRSTGQYVVAEIAEDAPIARDDLQRLLWAENVRARRYFFPGSHRSEPYRTDDPTARESMPHTDALARSVLTLPTGTAMSTDDVDTVAALLRRAMDGGAPSRAASPRWNRRPWSDCAERRRGLLLRAGRPRDDDRPVLQPRAMGRPRARQCAGPAGRRLLRGAGR